MRIIDILVSLFGLLILAPIFFVIGILIKLDSRGGVFYRARRVGKDGVPFELFKFRSMCMDADKNGLGITTAGDPRVTRIGRLLRRSKIDELPQLINVLRGEMSLVGPRPEDPRYVALYTPEQRRALSVRPGITSAASLAFRHEECMIDGEDGDEYYRTVLMPEKLRIDLEYILHRTIFSDLKLIFQTVLSMSQVEYEGNSMESAGAESKLRMPEWTFAWVAKLRNRHFLIVDVVLLLCLPTFALLLRLGSPVSAAQYASGLVFYTLVALAVRVIIFYHFGLYNRYWQYASIDEVSQIAVLGLVSTAFVMTLHYGLTLALPIAGLDPQWLALPWSVPVIDAMLVTMLVGATRFGIRLAERLHHGSPNSGKSKLVAIFGAGDAGMMILREIQRNPHLGFEVVCFVDDDAGKHSMRVSGIPVLGNRHTIPKLVRDYKIAEVIIATPRAAGKEIRNILDICRRAEVSTKIIPGIYALLDGTVGVNQLRRVELEDLLRRESVRTDTAAVNRLVRGKRVLVTGGGGSIGSELCRQILRCHPGELVLLGHGENSIFEIYHELRNIAEVEFNREVVMERKRGHEANNVLVLKPMIADIRSANRVKTVFEQVKPEIVFHAAAHKHVPLMEFNPGEAVTNNVVGTRNVVEAAKAVGVERFVMISTDKAVNPTSIMGASKRTAELIVLKAARETGKSYVAVRFGNVLGSRGSVVLTFQRQIAAGGPVTVTHPEMRRYFMTIPEAVQLVLQAGVLGTGGEVFVLDMGKPVKIVDLARDLIRLSGLTVGRDIDIEFSGLRPGEKLFEEMFVAGESYHRTLHEKVFIGENASSFVPEYLQESIEVLVEAARRSDRDAILRSFKALIPEFAPPSFADEPAVQPAVTSRPSVGLSLEPSRA